MPLCTITHATSPVPHPSHTLSHITPQQQVTIPSFQHHLFPHCHSPRFSPTDLNPTSLASLAWACGTLGWAPGQGWAQGFLLSSLTALRRLPASQLCDTLWGISRIRLPCAVGSDWKDEALGVSLGAMGALNRPAELVTLVAAVAALGCEPGQAWVAGALQHVRVALPGCSPRDLAEVLPPVVELARRAQRSQCGRSGYGTSPGVSSEGGSSARGGSSLDGGSGSSATRGSVRSSSSGGGTSAVSRPMSRPRVLPLQQPTPVPAATTRVRPMAPSSPPSPLPPEHAAPSPPILPRKWLSEYLRAARPALPRFTAQALVRVLACVVEAGGRPSFGWIAGFVHVLAGKLEVLGGPELCTLLASMSVLGYKPPRVLLQSLLEEAAPKLSSDLVSDAQLAAAAEALVRLGVSPEDSNSWTHAFLAETRARAPRLVGALLAQVARCVVQTPLPAPRAWWEAIAAAARPQLGHMGPQELGELLWAVSMSGVHPGVEWMDAATCAVSAQLAGLKPAAGGSPGDGMQDSRRMHSSRKQGLPGAATTRKAHRKGQGQRARAADG